MIYFILFLILLLGCLFFDNKRNHKGGGKYLYFEYFVIVLVFGLRYKVGGDTINYFYYFENWPNLEELFNHGYISNRFNIGWIFLSSLCKSIYDDFFVLQIVQALVVNAAFFSFFKKYTSNIYISIFLYGLMYMITFNTELMRASLAVSIFLLGFSTYLNKQWFKYYILAFIAMLFHNEAIIMFILPLCTLLSKIKTHSLNLLILYCVSVFSVVFLNFVPQLLSLFSMSDRVLSTFLLYSDASFNANLNGYIGQTIILMPWFFLLWISRNEKDLFWRGFIILFVFFGFQQLKYLEFMKRACDFLYPFTIVALVYGINYCNRSKSRLVKICIGISVLITVGVRLNSFVADEHYKLFYPYSSVIMPKENIERELLLLKFQGN